MHDKLADAIFAFAQELHASHVLREKEFEWFKSHAHSATKQDLRELGVIIMSKISEYAAAQTAFNDRQDAALTAIAADVAALNDTILKFQSTSGTINKEDQALLDALQARGATLTDKLEALDALTPPVVPTDPATGTPAPQPGQPAQPAPTTQRAPASATPPGAAGMGQPGQAGQAQPGTAGN